MQEKQEYYLAGDLEVELEEFKSLAQNEEYAEGFLSTTIKCGTFLTIYCC